MLMVASEPSHSHSKIPLPRATCNYAPNCSKLRVWLRVLTFRGLSCKAIQKGLDLLEGVRHQLLVSNTGLRV